MINSVTNILKRITYSTIIFTFSILSTTRSFSQSEFLYTVNSDLPNSNFSSLCQDSKGNIWIGTVNGLCRYDGAKFRTYNNYKNNQYKIHDNAITSLYSTDSGALYVGLGDRIQVLDVNSDSFKDVLFYDKQNKRIEINAKAFVKLHNDDILIGTLGHGIFLLKKGSLKAYPFHSEKFGYYFIDALHIDNKGRLWIGEERNGIIMYDNGRIFSIRIKNNATISSFCQTSSNDLYIGTSNGLYLLDLRNNKIKIIEGTENDVIVCLYKKDNQLLIGTETHGLKIYNIEGQRNIDRSFEITTIDQSKSKISFILIDSTGNYWLAINRKGILMKPAINNNFQYIGHKSINKDVIGDNSVNCIYKGRNNNLWIATDNDGLYCIDENGKQKAHFCKDKGYNIPNSIISIYEDNIGKLWIGSLYDGMACFDARSGNCQYIEALKGLTICGISSDKGGNLWVGTMGSGLYQFDHNGKLLYKAPMMKNKQYNPKANVLNNSWISSLQISHDNKLYIGTCYGLGCYDLIKKSYINSFNKNCILLGILINTVFEDSRHIIWIGTTQGLYSYNTTSKKINNYGLKQGLGNNTINAITEDKEGNLWLSTNYGLSKFDIKKKTFANFYANDGLQGNEFSPRAVFRDDNGIVYYGGLNGVTYFNPSSITKSMKHLNVRITDFYIHDQAVQLNSLSSGHKIIKKEDNNVTYHLGASDNSFCIEFATNSFSSSKSTIYEYSLDYGEWNALQPGVNKVYFSNMNARKYSFRVRANNYETKSKECEINIIIDNYWYATGWAFLVYFIVVGIISSYIYIQSKRRHAVKAKLIEQEQKDKISEAKLQFFINISHEIRTPMTLIISPIKKLIAMDKSPDCQKLYHTIYRNADKILLLVNQLMDIRKIDKGQMELHFQKVDIIPFIQKVTDMFEEAFTAHNINFEFNASKDNIYLYVDPLYFDKIIINLLSNAIKYTPDNGTIRVDIRTKEIEDDNTSVCEIEVYDNGIEIPKESLDKIFDRYYQINNNINEAKIGTGVGLNLTRSLVELHHGNISAMNFAPDEGASFIISIPIGRAHLNEEEMNTSVHDLYSQNDIPLSVDNEETISVPKKRSNKTILIAEDDYEIRTYLNDELSQEFKIVLCSNGKEALDSIFNAKPDLVISDVMMPIMDGITLCHKIKQNIYLNYIPVILLTAKTGESDTMEGLDMGADIYMTKPFNIQILHSTIINLLVGRERLKNIYEGNQQQDSKIEIPELRSPDDKLLERVMKYMNQNLTNPDYTVELLAKDVGLSRVHLHRKLKELTNQTTRDFMRNLRLQKAAELLCDKKMSITEVALTIGFQNTTYFSSAFKELHGVSPKEFRDRNN